MKDETINSIAVIGLLGTVALESFVLGQSRVIEYFVRVNYPLIHPIYEQLLVVIMTGFLVFFILGVLALKVVNKKEIEE